MSLSDRQSAAGRQGAAFERTVEILLQVEGWTIMERHWRHPIIDVEVDLVAKDPDGITWWIECKGSWESTRNGLQRTDTLKKLIGSAVLLRKQADRHPYMVVTSHQPSVGAGVLWLKDVLGDCVDELRVVGFITKDRGADGQ